MFVPESECTGIINWDYTTGHSNNGINDSYFIDITGNITNTGNSIINRTIIKFMFNDSYTSVTDVNYNLAPFQSHNFNDRFYTIANSYIELDTVFFRCE